MVSFEESIRQDVGKHLKFLAQKEGLTQATLAEKVGLSTSAISKVWRGITAKPAHYELVAECFDTSLATFVEQRTSTALAGEASSSSNGAKKTSKTATPSRAGVATARVTPHTQAVKKAKHAPRFETCQRVTVSSRKGGTAKTTTTVHLAGTLARKGYRVLLVDLDAQMDASEWLCGELSDATEVGQRLGSHELIRDGLDPRELITPSWIEGLDLILASPALDGIARETASDFGIERQLMSVMQPLDALYDFILYDTPAAFDVRTVNALMASSWVLIPSQPGPLDLKGLFNFLPKVLKFTDPHRFNPNLQLLGIVLCRVKNQTVMLREASDFLGEEFGELVFDTMISDSIRYQEVSGQQALIQDWEPSLSGEYEALVEELLARIERARRAEQLGA